jgi:transmembrane sensor
MSANGEHVQRLITDQAADWFIANRAAPTRKEQEAFAAWLRASPVHIEEYLSVAVVVRDLRAACADSADSLEDLLVRARDELDAPVEGFWPSVMRKPSGGASYVLRTVALATVMVGVLFLGLATWWSLKSRTGTSSETAQVWHFATRHGEQRTYTLPDRSVLHLNTDSVANIRYNQTDRLIRLTAGEAFFEVGHEPKRPFRVLAGSAQIVALGTQFNVRLAEHTTWVTVLQGVVAAGSSSSSRQPQAMSSLPTPAGLILVTAGQQIRITDGEALGKPVAIDVKRTAAWLRRQILFEHEPLQQVASEFNRYAAKPIEIVTPALQDLEISGVFATDDTDAFIAFLRSLDGVHVEVSATRIRVSQK